MTAIAVRAPSQADVPAMARVVVTSWRETYRGLMPDAVLDDPGLAARREQQWTRALTGDGHAAYRCAVGEHDGEVVGIAMSGPPEGPDSPGDRQLYVLYLRAAHHGSGGGTALLDAVLDPGGSAVLWVADPNPRAQAFYRRHGIRPDGAELVEDGVRELRMTRGSHGRAERG